MRRILAVLVLASLCSGGTAALSPDERKLNDDSFEYVWTTVRDKFWDPAIEGIDWNAVHAQLKPEMDRARTMEDARDVLRQMLDRLHLTHFEIIPFDAYSDLEAATAPRGDGETGIDLRVVDGKALVASVQADSPAARAGVKTGWEMIRAGTVATSAIVAKIHAAYRHSSLEDLMLRQALLGRAQGYVGETVEILFEDGQGAPVTKKMALARPRGTLSKFGFLPPTYVWIERRIVSEGIGYVRFNMFLDPAHVMPVFGEAVEACMSCRGFVIDLRGNPGGIGAMAMGMAGWFVDRSDTRLGTLYMRGSTLNFTISPRPEAYAGRLAILVDRTTASTSEILAQGLKDLKRARVFGTRTAAAALPSAIEMLPNGDGFQYAIANYISEGGKPLEGVGVTPDVEAAPTRQALLAGKDTALDAAEEWIRSPNDNLR